MSFLLHPLHLVAAVLTEWVRHEQEKVIEFLRTETEVLLEQLGDKRILLSDDDRRLLAVKGMALEKGKNFCRRSRTAIGPYKEFRRRRTSRDA